MGLEDGLRVLEDIASALVDLHGRLVHRDLKPENVLLLDGHWSLADFGISRYAEQTTGPDTRKFAMTPAYAAPERWRSERAVAATDVYSLGVIAFEVFSDHLPFSGPQPDDFREQHLHATPPQLDGVPTSLSALVDECLLKAAGARPSAADVLVRLERVRRGPGSPGLTRLQEASRAEVARQAEAASEESRAQTDAERRQELFAAAVRSFEGIASELHDALEQAASSAAFSERTKAHWTAKLGAAALTLSAPKHTPTDAWRARAPAFEVIAHASIALHIPQTRHGYQGRSHSVWFCDARDAGRYTWFETAFMFMPLMQRRSAKDPFALAPGEEAARALGAGLGDYQVAWPFTPLVIGDLDEFIDRWGGWFADAVAGRLGHPSHMPERRAEGSWRLT